MNVTAQLNTRSDDPSVGKLNIVHFCLCPGPDVIKLRAKFHLLIKTKIPTNKEVPCFKSLRCCIYHALSMINFVLSLVL